MLIHRSLVTKPTLEIQCSLHDCITTSRCQAGAPNPGWKHHFTFCTWQEEELLALQAIYGPECRADGDGNTVQVGLDVKHRTVTLCAHLPASYPSDAAPVVVLEGRCVTPAVTEWALQQLNELFVPGEPVLYALAEAVREHLEVVLDDDAAADDAAAAAVEVAASDAEAAEQHEQARAASHCDDDELHFEQLEQLNIQQTPEERAAEELTAAAVAGIMSGEPLTERKSTFQAHLAPVHSRRDVEAVMAALLQNSKIQKATHNIMAYRIWSEERHLFDQDCDDDGESAAGGRLLHLLEIMNVRDVVVVVSRWFGGVLMGPQRFTVINNTARMLLEECGLDHRDSKPAGRSGKRK